MMSVDEMDLVGQLKDVEPLRDDEFERAKMAVRSVMAASGAGSAPATAQATVLGQGPARGHHRPRRRTAISRGKVGLGIGAVAAAAAVAVAFVATSKPNTARPPAALASASAAPSSTAASAKATPPSSASLVVNSRLITVADVIKSHEGPLPGNASLILRTQTNGGVPALNFDLYTDSGDYYYGMTRSALIEAVASHDNISGGLSVREVAAALYAANGDLAAARVRMINATPNPFGLGDTPAEKKALAKGIAADNAAMRKRDKSIKISGPDKGKALQEDYDNYIWNNCMDALTEGGGNPQVRIGVLRLLATVPEVTVKTSTTDGQSTLTLTASTALFDGITDQVLTINASTGMPISSETGSPGQQPSSVTTYQISRVTLASIQAGKF
jgi:hypothetical protein